MQGELEAPFKAAADTLGCIDCMIHSIAGSPPAEPYAWRGDSTADGVARAMDTMIA